MTDYSWEVQERAEQKDLFEEHRKDRDAFLSDEKRNERSELKQKKVKRFFYDKSKLNLEQRQPFRAMKSNTELENITSSPQFRCQCTIKEKTR